MKKGRLKYLGLMALALVLIFSMTACENMATNTVREVEEAQAQGDEDYSYGGGKEFPLWAGQNIEAGKVSVEFAGDNLNVTYKIHEDLEWYFTELHLEVVGDVDDFSTNNSGNPQIGLFPHKAEDLWEQEYTFEDINVSDYDNIFIAAHAVVVDPTQLADGEEQFYLSSSIPWDEKNEEIPGTEIFEVVFDDAEAEANLTSLIILPDDHFDQVDAMAATPDGETLYFFDKESKHLGKFPVDGEGIDAFVDLGEVPDAPSGVVLATFSPDGTLYVASQDTNILYTVEINGPSLTEVGDTEIGISGADMAFDAYGDLYLYSNSGNKLYTIDLSTGKASTTFNSDFDNLTGLAFREGGLTDLVGSLSGGTNGQEGRFVLFNRDGEEIDTYPMLEDGEKILYSYGDMTTGLLGEPLEETAWASEIDYGKRFVERGSWATYFEYSIPSED